MHYGAEFSIGSIRVHPFPVPHDAREPVQYRFECDGLTLGILTDTGHISTHVAQTLAVVDAMAVEFNHDLETLNTGPYPQHLKARVGSNFGHLNNAQAAGLVNGLDDERLRWVVALHMSQQNNSAARLSHLLPNYEIGQISISGRLRRVNRRTGLSSREALGIARSAALSSRRLFRYHRRP